MPGCILTIAALTSFGGNGFARGSGLSGSLGGLSGFAALASFCYDGSPLASFSSQGGPRSANPYGLSLGRLGALGSPDGPELVPRPSLELYSNSPRPIAPACRSARRSIAQRLV